LQEWRADMKDWGDECNWGAGWEIHNEIIKRFFFLNVRANKQKIPSSFGLPMRGSKGSRRHLDLR